MERPVGADQPETTNVIVDNLRQTGVEKIDMLFVIDNSLSMGDKQELLAAALPDLVDRLVSPPCVSPAGERQPAAADSGCAAGFAREFQPIEDIHIGVITSSLGGFGATLDCTSAEEGETDNAHLLGSLPRGGAAQPGFLRWCVGANAERGDCEVTAESAGSSAFAAAFANQVTSAGERGCGWEATLEAWYRFLIDPYPWTEIVRQNCPFGGDTNQLCIGPLKNAAGAQEVDMPLLEQRRAFLRPDSLLAIVMLTDENDCSFKATGQSWRLSQTRSVLPDGSEVANKAYKGSSTCTRDPNDACCHSCGAAPPTGCPTMLDTDGQTVAAGCEEPRYASLDESNPLSGSQPTYDAVNLRCFNHKQRFGVDYLYPVARYTNALARSQLCPFADDLDPAAVDSTGRPICNESDLVPNPLYVDHSYEQRRLQSPEARRVLPRSQDLVFLAGIVGVPWQDLAVDPGAAELVYRNNRPVGSPRDARTAIDWELLLGSKEVGAEYSLLTSPPTDPLMHEQVEARTGTHPITAEPIGPTQDNSINTHDWNITGRDDLQYACTFDVAPRSCPEPNDPEVVAGTAASCDCTFYGDDEHGNPLCNGREQIAAKAYPSIRQLQVLRDFGANSIVASICPKESNDTRAPDYGYRPAVAAIVERLTSKLTGKCFPRELAVEAGVANCVVVEARAFGTTCDSARARAPVDAAVAEEVRERLERTGNCIDAEDCQRFHLCEIQQLDPTSPEYGSCLDSEHPSGDGWCYVDPAQGLGDPWQVERCPETERRKIRFVGAGAPDKGTVTFFACAGAPQGIDSDE